MFERSFRTAATLAHRAIVMVYAVESMEAFAVYIVHITLFWFRGVGISDFCVFFPDDVRGHFVFCIVDYRVYDRQS